MENRASIFLNPKFMTLSVKGKGRTIILATLLFVPSFGAVAFVGLFAGEIYLLFTCGGARCYESTLALVLYPPLIF